MKIKRNLLILIFFIIFTTNYAQDSNNPDDIPQEKNDNETIIDNLNEDKILEEKK